MASISKVLFILILCCTPASSHTVEQLFMSLEKSGKEWQLDITFDAAYGLPEFRDDTDAPQPERDWLVGLSAAEHARLRSESEQYLRQCLSFTFNNRVTPYHISFPDYASSPPDFPHLLNGGAYTLIRITGELPQNESGDFVVQVAEGQRPDFVIATGSKDNRGYHHLKPSDHATLFTTGQSGHEMAEAPGMISLIYMGFWHVLPAGLDHILFILALFLMVRQWRPLVYQSLLFTVAHSITLGLAASGNLKINTWPGASQIEPLIALSIVAVAVENLFYQKMSHRRAIIVFTFGLIHGLGFAGSLGTSLQAGNTGILAILLANLGVELAQVTILAVAWFLTMRWFALPIYQTFRLTASIIIAAIGFIWFIQRLFG